MTRTTTYLIAGALFSLTATPAMAEGWSSEPFTQSLDQRGGAVGDFPRHSARRDGGTGPDRLWAGHSTCPSCDAPSQGTGSRIGG